MKNYAVTKLKVMDAYNHLIPIYHIRQQWNLVPVCGVYQHLYFELAQSLDCRNKLYQRTRVAEVSSPEM